jgi:hypothetical protein
MGIDGILREHANASATLVPTNSAPDKPGPEVYAIESSLLNDESQDFNNSWISGMMYLMWSLDASSGTTPP